MEKKIIYGVTLYRSDGQTGEYYAWGDSANGLPFNGTVDKIITNDDLRAYIANDFYYDELGGEFIPMGYAEWELSYYNIDDDPMFDDPIYQQTVALDDDDAREILGIDEDEK